MTKETNNLQIVHSLMPQSLVRHVMYMESRGPQALLAVQGEVMGQAKVNFLDPASQSPVKGIEVKRFVPPLPVPPADRLFDNVLEEQDDQK